MEYKFRGLGLHSKKWIYGNLIHMEDADKDFKDVIIPIEDNCTYVDNDDGYGAENWHKVDSKTVSPSTGVKDINKKESYLGDILKEPNNKYDYGIIEKESESNNMFITWWYPSNSECKLWNSMKLKLSYIKQFEIIGNIFENEDMVKKEG